MILFNQLINQINELLKDKECKVFPYRHTTLKTADKNSIIFQRDMAYELGGSAKPCVSTMAVTSSVHFDDSIYLYGKDMYEISGDCPFGKIVLIEIDDVEEQDAFDKIKELELVTYSFCPEGTMTRSSAINMREQIRVSKKAVKSRMSFSEYGSALIDSYRQNPAVKSIQIIFITQDIEFSTLSVIADKIKNTTSALNHILDNILFDCSSCNLKAICDEVEGMKELHMKSVKQ